MLQLIALVKFLLFYYLVGIKAWIGVSLQVQHVCTLSAQIKVTTFSKKALFKKLMRFLRLYHPLCCLASGPTSTGYGIKVRQFCYTRERFPIPVNPFLLMFNLEPLAVEMLQLLIIDRITTRWQQTAGLVQAEKEATAVSPCK